MHRYVQHFLARSDEIQPKSQKKIVFFLLKNSQFLGLQTTNGILSSGPWSFKFSDPPDPCAAAPSSGALMLE